MEADNLRDVPPRKNRSRKRTGLILLAAILLGIATAFYWVQYVPTTKHEVPSFDGNSKPIFYKGALQDGQAEGKAETLKLPFDLVKEIIDPTMIYESSTDSTIITTKDKVLRLKTSQLTGMINEKPFNLKFPVEKINGKLYMPMDPLKDLYRIELRESAETGAVILLKEGDTLQWGMTQTYAGKPDKTIAMRKEPSIKSPILADLQQGEAVMIWSEEPEWYKVQLTNGYEGYIHKDQLLQNKTETVPAKDLPPSFVPTNPISGKINLTWDQMTTSKNPDTSKFPPMPGLNVVSPTWFHLDDGQGTLKNLADPAYVKWAHSQNIQVWALFSNGFEPKRTTEALATYDLRMKMIKQLLSYAQMYSLQGINIDFENVSTKDKDNLTQFVREMVPLLHEQGLVVSMDVTPKSNSEMWSLFYDRKALIQSLDYMMIMAYDEYWASSPTAGSVSSLPWVESHIAKLMKEDQIPASKLILGVPFYTRVWTEEVVEGKTKVSSRSVYMDNPQKTIKEKNLTPVFLPDVGQNYVEYKDGDKLNKIWLEDEVSMKARLDLVNKYNLAGVASWRRGYETPTIWTLIQSSLANKP